MFDLLHVLSVQCLIKTKNRFHSYFSVLNTYSMKECYFWYVCVLLLKEVDWLCRTSTGQVFNTENKLCIFGHE